MSTTIRGRRAAYDNIASGQATGRELTILGDTASNQEVYGGGYVNSTSNNERHITKIVADTVSTSDAGAQGPENMTGAVDPTDERTGSSNGAGFVTNA
jgi:hypothetical protein